MTAVTKDQSLLVLLLRQRSLRWIEWQLDHHSNFAVATSRGRRSAEEALDRLRSSLRHLCPQLVPWRLSSDGEGVAHFEEMPEGPPALAADASWTLMPWGAEETGLMVAIRGEGPIVAALLVSLEESSCADLLVGVYTQREFEQQHFRGLVFERAWDLRGEAIWGYTCGREGSAYLAMIGLASSLPEGAARVVAHRDPLGPWEWVRVTREASFVELVRCPGTILAVGAEMTSSLLNEQLDAPMWKQGYLHQDAIHFALAALPSALWAYIPPVGREQREVFMHMDAEVTARLLRDGRMAGGPSYQLVSPC